MPIFQLIHADKCMVEVSRDSEIGVEARVGSTCTSVLEIRQCSIPLCIAMNSFELVPLYIISSAPTQTCPYL